MIKKFETLFEDYPDKFIKDFLCNCTVTEKISAFYIHVKIVSDTCIKICKANQKEIRKEDIILNKMWNLPVNDFTHIFFKNEKLMKYTGYVFSFFFFPVNKPFNVTYKNGFRYILSFVKDKFGNSVDIRNFDLSVFGNEIKQGGIILHDDKRNATEINKIASVYDYKDGYSFIMNDLIGKDNNNICAESFEEAEGFILKWKKNDFQILQNEKFSDHMKINRLPLEFVIHDFSQFLKNFQEWIDYTSNADYSTNVSLLFNEYISHFNEKEYSSYNITADDLTAPNFGYYGGTGIEFIPVKKTRELCLANPFFKNIFKILLNGLQKEKVFKLNMVIITEEDIDFWNKCVKLIKK